MTLIENAIIDLLTNDSGITAEVSSRVRVGRAQQGETFPYIVVQVISDQSIQTNDGPTGQAEADVDVFSFATTAKEAAEVDEAVRSAVQGYSGTNESVTINDVTTGVTRDVQPDPDTAEDNPVFGKTREVKFWYQETTS